MSESSKFKSSFNFFNFDINPNGFSCDFIRGHSGDIKSDRINFVFEKALDYTHDQIALVLSTLCRREFDLVYMDLEISSEVNNLLEKIIAGKFSVKNVVKRPFKKCDSNDRITMSFSGGIDSLALYQLIGDKTDLVSVNWGGGFSKEKNIYQDFNTFNISSNIRILGLCSDTIDLHFMNVGTILTQNIYKNRYYTCGTILDCFTCGNLKLSMMPEAEQFYFLGLKMLNFTPVLSEVATMKIVYEFAPDIFDKSLITVAPPGIEKFYRKSLISLILKDRFSYNVNLTHTKPPLPREKLVFGRQYLHDFLSFYFLKHAYDIEKEVYETLPPGVEDLIAKLKLDFYERYNPDFLSSLPRMFRSQYVARMDEAGIFPYTSADWAEIAQVMAFMKPYHKYVRI